MFRECANMMQDPYQIYLNAIWHQNQTDRLAKLTRENRRLKQIIVILFAAGTLQWLLQWF